MRWVILATILLAGCGHKGATSNQESAAGNAPAENASAAVAPLPSPSAEHRFVGIWAANKAECTSKPWRFTVGALDSTGGPKCSFYKVTKGPDGYDIAAQCPTKKPVPTDLIKLRFAESTQSMLVESNAIPPTGLVYCGK